MNCNSVEPLVKLAKKQDKTLAARNGRTFFSPVYIVKSQAKYHAMNCASITLVRLSFSVQDLLATSNVLFPEEIC